MKTEGETLNAGKMRAERKVTIILLCAIILLALFLQTYSLFDGLSHDDIWMREIMEANLSTIAGFSGGEDINNVSPDDGPLYFVIMHFWIGIFTASEVSLKLFSIFAGLLSLPLFYLIGKFFNRWVGLMSAFLFSISVHFVENSQLIRPYTLYLLLSLLSIFFFIRYLKDCRKQDIMLFILFSVLNVYTQYFAFLLLDIEILFFLVFTKKKKVEFLTASFIIYLLAVPLLLRMPSGIIYNQEAAGPNPCGPLAFFNSIHYNIIQYFLIILLIGIFLIGLKNCSKKNKMIALFSGMLFFGSIVFSAAISCLILFKIKHLIFIFPFFFAVISDKLLKSKKKWRALALLAIVVMSALSLADYYQRPSHEDWQSAFNYINNGFEKGDMVLISDYANRPRGDYLKTDAWIMKDYTMAQLNEAFKQYKRVWIVINDESAICDDCKTGNMGEVLGYLNGNYPLIDKKIFGGGERLHDTPVSDLTVNLYEIK